MDVLGETYPTENDEADEFPHWQFDQEESDKGLHDQLRKVDNGPKPRVIFAVEIGIRQ